MTPALLTATAYGLGTSPLAPATVAMIPPGRAVGLGKAAGLDGRHALIAATVGELVGLGLPVAPLPVAPQLVSTATPAARPKILENPATCPTEV